MWSRLIPEDLILKLVALRIIVDHEALEVLRALIHDLTEGIEVGEHARILLVELPTVADDVLTEDEDVVYVRAEIRGNADGILHRDDEHRVDVAAVHEEVADVAIADPAAVIQTVIQNQEVPWVDGGRAAIREILENLLADQLLTLEHVGDDEGRILLVDEHRGHHLTIELVGTLRAGNHGAAGETLVVPEEILHEE